MPGRTPEGDALTDLVLPVFELNGEFLAAAAMITAPHELTPARWQVLGAVLDAPLPVPEIARRIGLGLTRQSVQRVANDVVAQGWAVWQPNPARRGQSLLTLTERGRDAVNALADEQHAWANAVGRAIGVEDLEILRSLISQVTKASRNYRPNPAQ
ncbi:MarR family transcriptional regulator [Actinomyces massiliensis]|uniref:MarR family winged helix-turn-helix transcriptional regulator n=1 Tax=Actinomyces massiliensis TaxID=461393 RepID=UPI002357D64E|nr:MarR family transcriptional regulator [Actinomyces massiliensis]